jgi:Protein of unknown function (DUF1501)
MHPDPMQNARAPFGFPNQGSRRSFLKLGGISGAGFGSLGWSNILWSQALQNGANGRAKRCILLWQDGGPSHLEMWDPKPDAPIEVRGPFRSIATNVPGIAVCEHLSASGNVMDKLAIIRSMTSPLGEHGIANHYLLTGHLPSPQITYPSFGSLVARHLESDAKDRDRQSKAMPSYVTVPETTASMGAGFLGRGFEPLATGGDPSQPNFAMKGLQDEGLSKARLQRRREMLNELNANGASKSTFGELDSVFESAFELIGAGKLAEALRIQDEVDSARDRYGRRSFGQSCLLARRLIERGVPMVSVVQRGWDTHDNLTLSLRDGFSGAKVGVGLIPTFDQAFSALIEDLDRLQLLNDTLVVAMGEFGRTPKLNPRGGRDHWPRVFSAVLAGAKIHGGQVIGASDRVGESPLENPVTPAELSSSILQLIGTDPRETIQTAEGRPIRIAATERRIEQLF